MVIKRSAGQEIQALIAELGSEDEVRRETAIARLAVIGTRAVDRLLAAIAAPAPVPTMVAALQALESIADFRSLAPALSLLHAPEPEVATAAVGLARAFLHSRQGNEVLDRLVALALDPATPEAPRLAALDALTEMGDRVLLPVWKQLEQDPSAAVRQRASRAQGKPDPVAELEAAAAGSLPDDAAALETLVEKTSSETPLATLHRLLEAVMAREQRASRRTREAWLSARGAIHLALAVRGSRVALYDLRESIERACAPLPVSFVWAITAIGDVASLEAIAAAYARAIEPQTSTGDPALARFDEQGRVGEIRLKPGPTKRQDQQPGEPASRLEKDWLEQLRAAFTAIAAREGVTARHAAVKRMESKFPAAAPLLSTLSQNTRASKRPSRT